MEKPLVSVIMAVKNGERFLAEAIESVLSQTYEPYEIIVVDGQSTDSTEKIAKSYKPVRYIRQTGQGVADAYNAGIDAARGEFVAFLSHDDLWAPNKLSVQVDYLISHPEIQYTVAKAKFFLEEGYSIPPGFKPELLEGEPICRTMETLVVRKTLFEEIGKLNPEFSPADDVDWFARAKDRKIPMAVIPEVLLSKRIHDANTSLSDQKLNNQLLLRILKQSIERQRSRRGEKE
ncbi:glycosyltransferase [Kamptonema formosum]|uniref:glycosyltransferase n=1 Tax=Kamptonema formosum TaxID=331992 RepID=UPI0003485A89|nr:glycosyltransferase [Oscillatoria sp. PCC 10802]